MLKILFDHQIFSLQPRGGISRYFCELVEQLNRQNDVSAAIIPFIHQNGHLDESAGVAKHCVYVPYNNLFRAPLFLFNATCFEIYRRFSKPGIVHRTYYYNGYHGSHKQVLTVHDLIPEQFPHGFIDVEHLKHNKFKSISESDHIICNSHKTRHDLLDYYGTPEQKVSVVYMASSLSLKNTVIKAINDYPNASLKAPYILFVGSRLPYKNFPSLLNAIGSSSKISRDFRLICLGGPPFTANELAIILKNKLTGRVIHMDGDDDRLFHLYLNADLFVYPSILEGFGIPIIEAMSLGCPVACSKIEIFEEIAGASAQYFEPHIEESIKFALESVLYSRDRRDELKKAGFRNAMRFSWERCAAQTLSIYRSI